MDGSRSKLVNFAPGVPQDSILGLLLLLIYSSELFSILENKLTGYADDSTWVAVVPFPRVRVMVAESLIRDSGRVGEWCDLRRMKWSASTTKTMIVSRSRTIHPQLPRLTINETVLKESEAALKEAEVTYDSKMAFEKDLRSVSRAALQRVGILINSW